MRIKFPYGMRYTISNILGVFLVCLAAIIYFDCPCDAANLDELYRVFLKKDSYLYNAEIRYFRVEEAGSRGDPVYDKFESTPYFYSLNNFLKFSPLSCLELTLGFHNIFPAKYKRLTYNLAGDLAVSQGYKLDYFRDYALSLRMRKEPIEIYLDFLEKRQKNNWDSANLPASPNYFSYIRTHYEDAKLGLRYLSVNNIAQEKSNLSKLKRPLLGNNQINLEAELGYKNGKLRRNANYYYAPWSYFMNFYHTLKYHFIPGFRMRYGLTRNLEAEGGLYYTTPFRYEFRYKEYWSTGTTFFANGNYKLENNFRIPLKLRFRPKDCLEIMLSLDSHFVDQRLDYWNKETDDTITTFPSEKITYYNTQPSLNLTYLFDGGKEIQEDELTSLTKELLLKGQFLVEFSYQKDLTHLNKDSFRGPLNIIDPYNVFLYPLDYFVSGTEYAAFFAGNISRFATNIHPQNYYLAHFALTYGMTDNFNAGFRLGYHSSSSLHHFTLYDLNNRFYRFKPYYFFDFFCDWRMTKSSIISFNSHFVPNHTTFLNIEGNPREFKSKTRYFGVSLAVKILF